MPREPRAEPWGERSRFVLARVAPRGVFKAWSVTCNLHKADGQRCNKSLSMGSGFTSEEARRRIKEWCVRGLTIPDTPGGKAAHMDKNPRFFAPTLSVLRLT